MAESPTIVDRVAQPFAGVRRTVAMNAIPEIADQLPRIAQWLAEQGLQPTDAPFLQYEQFLPDGRIVMVAGFPVSAAGTGADEVFFGELPAGRYLQTSHRGPYDGLWVPTGDLLAWADEHGLEFDRTVAADRTETWRARLEIYPTNPRDLPDPATWVTHLAFRLGDGTAADESG